jgi:mono/diheme cytochrome c family protein
MSRTLQTLTATVATLALTGCASTYSPLEGYEQVEPSAVPDSPQAVASAYPAKQVERGRYLVGLLGCGSCHTDGALIGEPNAARLLAGSDVGIATSDPLTERHPGVLYPANLTPDRETGIGDWTLQQMVTMLQSGTDKHGSQSVPVMPFITYSRLLPQDATAIAMYLKSLPPVQHRVPANVRSGQRATAAFVHFGIYRSRQ